jgi:uncharacterized membrane protein
MRVRGAGRARPRRVRYARRGGAPAHLRPTRKERPAMPLVPPPAHERHKPRNVNEIKKETFTLNDRIALRATAIFGSMAMFWALCVWSLLPLIPLLSRFNAFVLYISAGIIQLIALPLLLVGSNLVSKHAEIRADEEFRTTMTSYGDIEHIMQHLSAQDDELLKHTKMLEELLRRRAGGPPTDVAEPAT